MALSDTLLLTRLVRSPRGVYRWLRRYPKRSITVFLAIAHLVGALTSVRVIMGNRTPQGAAAWAIALNTFPLVAVPVYWCFGNNNFDGYRSARKSAAQRAPEVYQQWLGALSKAQLVPEDVDPRFKVLSTLAGMPFTNGNSVSLLIDGEPMFDALFEEIDRAEEYILIQYYIVRDDDVGNKLKERLIAKSREGVQIYFLYDEVGSVFLGSDYVESLRAAGVRIRPFSSNLEDAADFRLNFRNHRKMLVVDGAVAITGGCNIGEEYLGEDPDFGPWRDTNVRVKGPIVQALQVAFSEDWRWATNEALTGLCWDCPTRRAGKMSAICLPMGPAEEFDACALFYHSLIGAAQKRLWIATPYFVPDEAIVTALQLAALRGVDVRVLIPEKVDSKLVYFSTFTYFKALEKAGVKIYRYQKGFLHQKVVLVDSDFASVGTANFDNRSFRLNFEVNVGVADAEFASQVAAMLERDLANSQLVSASSFEEKSFLFRFAAHVSRLLAPIQ